MNRENIRTIQTNLLTTQQQKYAFRSQLSQYLLSADKTIVKLNDFNRAEFMLWDEVEEEYCKYGTGHAKGIVSFCGSLGYDQ